MATLQQHQGDSSNLSLKRGTTNRQLGAQTVMPTTPAKQPVDFTSWAKNFTGQVAGGSAQLAKKVGSFVVNTPKYVYEDVKPFLGGVAKTITGDLGRDLQNNRSQQRQLDEQTNALVLDYKSGKISKDNYALRMRDISSSYQELSDAARKTQSDADRGNVVESAASTAATILLGGRARIANTPKAALRRTAGAATTTETRNKVIQSIVEQNATKLERAVTTIPAVRDLVYRNLNHLGRREAQKLAGENMAQYVAREGKSLAINFLLKRPILYQTNIEGAQDVYNHILEGEYGDAAKQSAWLGTQMLSGGPLGAAFQLGGKVKSGTRKLAYGQASFIDEVSKQIGTKNSNQVAEYLTNLKANDPIKFKEAERVLRVVQEANLQVAGEDVTQAANRVLQHWDEYGIKLDDVTPEKVVGLLKNWSDAHELKNVLIKTGKIPGINSNEAGKYVVVRWDNDARRALSSSIGSAGDDIQAITEAYQRWALAPGNAAGQNQILTNKIEQVINTTFKESKDGRVAKAIAEQIDNLSAASVMSDKIPDKYKKQFAELGFAIAQPSRTIGKITPDVNYEDTRKLITAAQTGDTELFDVAEAANPTLNSIAKSLERLGVSPNESNQAANRVLSQQVVANLQDLNQAKTLGFGTGAADDTTSAGRVILSKLQQYVEDKQPSKIGNALVAGRAVGPAVTDIRQLTPAEIVEALGVSKDQAKAIKTSIIGAYAKVPMEFRGLGDKVIDNLYKYNPLHGGIFDLPGYSRIQSALRYTYNPFFRTQEAVETAVLSRAQARSSLWLKSKGELNDAAKVLDEAGIFKTGLSGEAAQDLVLGRITANITPGQKRNLAGLAMSMAKSRNMTLEQMVKQHPQDVEDALRVVVQYPNKGVLNSSLARTLNVAFFPARYNAKVTRLAAEVLSREAPSVQLATINSLFNLRDWLKSDEGIRWQSDNIEAIQAFNWLTPIGSIKYGLERLTRRPDSIGELGSLGGLPLGVITQILDSQGIININTPYVSPKTGDVIPKYIPDTTKARAATALGDILNSMFTYPGRVLGLPGKNQAINKAVRSVIDTRGTDFEKQVQTDRLTPLQEKWIRVLKGDTSSDTLDSLYHSPAEGEFNWYTLPPLDVPIKTPLNKQTAVARRTGLPTKASRKKGARKKPTALPISG